MVHFAAFPFERRRTGYVRLFGRKGAALCAAPFFDAVLGKGRFFAGMGERLVLFLPKYLTGEKKRSIMMSTRLLERLVIYDV